MGAKSSVTSQSPISSMRSLTSAYIFGSSSLLFQPHKPSASACPAVPYPATNSRSTARTIRTGPTVRGGGSAEEIPDQSQVMLQRLPARTDGTEVFHDEPTVVADPFQGHEKALEVHDPVFERGPTCFPHPSSFRSLVGGVLQVYVRQVGPQQLQADPVVFEALVDHVAGVVDDAYVLGVEAGDQPVGKGRARADGTVVDLHQSSYAVLLG